MQTYYIYSARNRENNLYYIGKTKNYRKRLWQHMRCYEKEDCKFHDAIKKYGFDGFEWEILETCQDEHKADQLEKYYIKKFNAYRKGYNMNKGGVGGHNSRPVVCLTLDGEYVKRYDSAADAESLDGYCNSDVLLSCKHSYRTCQNHIFMFEDEYKTKGARKYTKPKSVCMKKIIQCDLKGNYIHEFESVNDAAELTGICRTTISGVLTGTYKSAGGYIFVYEDKFPITDIEKYKKKKNGKS